MDNKVWNWETLAFVALCTIGLETPVVRAFLSEFFVPVGNFGSLDSFSLNHISTSVIS